MEVLSSMTFFVGAVFFFVYAGIAVGRVPGLLIDRTGIALVGAIVLLSVGAIDLREAGSFIDVSTICLLFGLMIVSAQLRESGFYGNLSARILHSADRPFFLLFLISSSAAVLSAVFANDIVCLAFTPVICEAFSKSRRNPVPYLLALAASSNIGSAATLIGNPQNMFIGQVGNLSFAGYFALMGPFSLLFCFVNSVWIFLLWREELKSPSSFPSGEVRFLPSDQKKMRKALIITALLFVAFLSGLPREICALTAAALLLISRRTPAARLYALLDWGLILLFLGLFIVIGTFEKYGLLEALLAKLRDTGADIHNPGVFVFFASLLSNIVSNVPAVLLLKSIPGHSEKMWYLLAMSSTLAGNLTLIGSIANIIVAEKADTYGIKLGFWTFFRTGFFPSVISIAAGFVWIHFLVK